MNKNDLAALAALGAMGWMYMNRDKGGPGGTGSGEGAEPVRGAAADFVNRGGAGAGAGGMRPEDVVYGGDAGVGTAGQDKRSDKDDFAIGNGGVRARDVVYGGGKGGGGGSRIGSNATANMNTGMGRRDAGYGDIVSASELGSQSFPSNLPPPAAEEDTGISGTTIALGGAGAAGAAAAAYKAKRMAEAQAEEARARRVAEVKRGILADRAQAQVDADRAAITQAESRAAAQEQARAAAEERAAMDEEIRRRLRKIQNKIGPGTPDRSAVLNKDAWLEGPSTDKKFTTLGKTVVHETPAETKARNAGTSTGSGRGTQGGASAAEMDEFSKMLREKTVGTTAKAEASAKAGKVAKGLGKAALVPVLASITSLAKAGQYKEAAALAAEVGLTPWQAMAGEAGAPTIYNQSTSGRAATAAEIEEEKKKPGAFQQFKNYIVAKKPNEKAGGGRIKAAPAKRMASGGMTSKASSASKRGDGIASKGKTNCKMY